MIIGGIISSLAEQRRNAKLPKLKGKAVLMRKNALDLNDYVASFGNAIHEILNLGVTCQLVSSTVVDPNNGNRGVTGPEERLEDWVANLPSFTAGETSFTVTFNWDVQTQGVPGAVLVRNNHATEFFLKTITIDDVPGCGDIVFLANSWVYPACKYGHYTRVFFTNDAYLPAQTPPALQPYRRDELHYLRGDDNQGPYQEHDRVYRYDFYNDLGKPDTGNPRRTLGGSDELPYPRRGRTGRRPMRTDPAAESRDVLPIFDQFYVPRDERFGHLKQADFSANKIKVFTSAILPLLRTKFDPISPEEFDDFADILKLYEGGLKIPECPALDDLRKNFPLQLLKGLIPNEGDFLLKLPLPQVIKESKTAWRTDEEFGREMLAGVNPLIITRLMEFPPRSKLDPSKYGDQTSKITAAHIERNLEGLTVRQALDCERLFILDHHDRFMPHLLDVNSLHGNFIYATRTLLFLRGDGTLKPVAIELSQPKEECGCGGGGVVTAVSKVYTPASVGVQGSIWQLAKAYAAVNDSAWHQLVSHWLNTHAVIEPFVIATNRQLSVAHPIHKLLHPHYRDTMNINAMARQMLISAGGIFEMTVFPGKYALELSSKVYKSWNFTDQALPMDLIKRGMAKPDPSCPHGLKLVIEDYPYAADGLAIWSAIEQWVAEYCAIYYPNDGVLRCDAELQAWWKEVREVGHGDLKDRQWWPEMKTVQELVRSCATIIWIASALHAAVNFGQYPYAGYLPNRPTVSRRAMPEPGTKEYAELEKNPELAFIHTITSQMQTIIGVSLIEVLSNHSSDEVYLGQRDTPEWTSDDKAKHAFERFRERLIKIEGRITTMNQDPLLKNRTGPVKFPYTLLYPNTSDADGETATGVTAKGIPNSISI